MSAVQSLAIAAAALVMSYTQAEPPEAFVAAVEHTQTAAERAQVAVDVYLQDLIDCRIMA